MARAKASRLRNSATLTGWRQALVFAVLVAFALQGYIVQTHIHFSPEAAALLDADAGAHASKDASHHDKYPPADDPANCPICQEILHSGQFVTPSATALVPPSLAASTIAIVDVELPFVFALSHSWRGRAPPHS
jgi:Protein of unknown function (DUF2946)